MSKTKVLFVSQEILPFSAESPNATSGRYLPQAVHEKGKETRIFMPRYGKINEQTPTSRSVIRLSGMNLIVNDTDHPLIIKVASIPQIRIQVYFIDNEEYFHRKAYFTDESGTLFPDNDMRMIFFTKGVLETVKRLGWSPDIIHCHGWFTSLMPMYIKKLYRRDPYFAESKIVLSLYDDSFEGSLNTKLSDKIAFDGIDKKFMGNISNPSYVNLCKLGLEYSDAVILGSENVNSKVEQYASQLDVPLLRQYEEEDYLTAVDEFYDYAVLGKSVLVD